MKEPNLDPFEKYTRMLEELSRKASSQELFGLLVALIRLTNRTLELFMAKLIEEQRQLTKTNREGAGDRKV